MTPPGIGREPEGGARSSRLAAFLGELKQRQVFQSAGAYAVIAWGITEILDGVISRFGWPDWIATLVVVLFVVGFPVAWWMGIHLQQGPRGIWIGLILGLFTCAILLSLRYRQVANRAVLQHGATATGGAE